MNAPRKFLFETTFETAEASDKAGPVKKEPVKTFSEEDIAKARDDGFIAGREAGQKAAEQLIERDVAQALSTMTRQLAELGKIQAEAIEQRSREAVEAALAVIRKLFPNLAEKHGMAEIEAIVGECLARLRDEPRVVIRVADCLLDAVNERVKMVTAEAGFEGKVVLLAQNDLQAGDVRVEWADGGAERDSTSLWREIDEVVIRVIGAAPAEAASATMIDPEAVALTQESDRPKAASH